MQKTVDIEALKSLFEEMLEGERAQYLAGYTDPSGNVHPSGARRWAFAEKDYRDRLAKALDPFADHMSCVICEAGVTAMHECKLPYDPKDHTNCTACHEAGVRHDHNPINPPAPKMLPVIIIDWPGNEKRGGQGHIEGGKKENLCYSCGRLLSEHDGAQCPPDEIIPK